jgi:hypothetical protein
VARHYAGKVNTDPLRRGLDRRGGSLSSAGDTDMSLCSCEIGLAVGMFPDLRLTHLIPKERLAVDYLIKLAKGLSQSNHLLRYIWEGTLPTDPALAPPPCRADRLYNAYKRWRMRGAPVTFSQRINEARNEGLLAALQALQSPEASLGGLMEEMSRLPNVK